MFNQAIFKRFIKSKLIIILFLLIFLYLAFIIYTWVKTESTDNAYLDANISNISSEVSGVIRKVYISDNTFVKSGDIIAEIDNRDYIAKLRSNESLIKASKYNIDLLSKRLSIQNTLIFSYKDVLDYALLNLEQSRVEYNRTIKLKLGHYLSQKILDKIKLDLEKAKTDYTQAKSKLDISYSELDLINLEKSIEEEKLNTLLEEQKVLLRSLENTKIVAPVDGIITNSNIQIGNFVVLGKVLFSIVSNKIYVRANFKETQVSKFYVGQNVRLKFDAIPKKNFIGKIRSISPATGSKFALIPNDNATGNFTKIVQRVSVLIDLDLSQYNDNLSLVPGMSVTVRIKNK